MAELRLLIADDHELIRRGLRSLLAGRPQWQVVGEASNGVEAVEMAAGLRPDIVILDFFMPRLNGPDAAIQILQNMPDTRVLVLTMDSSPDVIRDVVRAGASGLVLKSDADRDLLYAIEQVARNRTFFTSDVASKLVTSYLTGKLSSSPKLSKPASKLTEREREIMRILADGMTSREAAVELQISVRTVESHRINISRKLGLTSVAGLVKYAIRHGILTEI